MNNVRINSVSDQMIEFENHDRMQFDMIVWSAGRTAVAATRELPFVRERGETIATSETGVPKIPGVSTLGRPVYVAGDVSSHPRRAAWIAPNALREGKMVGTQILAHIDYAERLPQFITQKTLHPKNDSIFLLGTRKGITTVSLFIPQRIVGIIRQLVDLRYFLRILPVSRALSQWKRTRNLYK